MQIQDRLVFASPSASRHGQRGTFTTAGVCRADETIIGGPVKGKRGRAVTDFTMKTLIFGAVEVISFTDKNEEYRERAGRIRLATTPNADEKSIEQFLEQNVEKGSTIRTDGWRGYSNTALSQYKHNKTPGMRLLTVTVPLAISKHG